MADEDKAPVIDKATVLKLVQTVLMVIVGAAVAMFANWLGVKAPDTITIPVTVQAAPAPAVDEGGMFEARPRLIGFRARLHAEIDRRASLDKGNVWHLDTTKANDAHAFVGKLGDGHLLELLIRYGPDIIMLIIKILGLMAVL